MSKKVSRQTEDGPPNPGNPYCSGRVLVGSFIFDAVCRCRELSDRAKLVFALLCQYAVEKGEVTPSYRTIGHDAGIGQRQAMRAVRELESFGLIKVVNRMRQDGEATNVYDFLWHNIYQDQLAELQND